MPDLLSLRVWLPWDEVVDALTTERCKRWTVADRLTEIRETGQLKTRIRGSVLEVERQSVLDYCRAHGVDAHKLDPDRKADANTATAGYTTELMEAMREAVQQFWMTYDADQPNTAPSSEDIVEWLITKKGISQQAAKAIDLIIRHDSRKPGGRKTGKV